MSYLYIVNKRGMAFLISVICLIVILGFSHIAQAKEHGSRHQQNKDNRFQHNHNYPVRGGNIVVLPRGHREVFYHNSRYHFHDGVWYRPWGSRFLIVAPPMGLIVPFLPSFYSTVWFAGKPYYYANDVYYTPTVGGYVVVPQPQGEVSQTPPDEDQTQTKKLFIYPREGQSQQKQADDRYACHSWAVDQANYDPTKTSAVESKVQRDNYRRAMTACLDGRGYTVK